MKTLVKLLNKMEEILGTSQSKREKAMMQLAQTEYAKDWQYAYQMLLEGKKP